MEKILKKTPIFLTLALVFIAAPVPLLALDMGRGISTDSGMPGSTDSIAQVSRGEIMTLPHGDIPRPYNEELELYKQWLELQDASIPSERGPCSQEDTSVDSDAPPAPSAPTRIRRYPGIADTGWFPADPILGVGPNHVVVMVNRSLAFYNKTTGAKLFETTFTNWWSSVSPPGNPFDPKVIYDHHAGRWVLVAVANNGTNISSYMISVSDDSNPNGSWWHWKLDATLNGSTSTNNWADYPQIGFDNSGAIYITSNQYAFGGSFQYAKLRILKKSQLYWVGSGGTVNWYDFWGTSIRNADGTYVYTLQPVHTLTSPDTQFLVNTENWQSGNAITLWRVYNATSSSPSLSRMSTIPIRSYSAPPNAVQRGGTTRINTMDSRAENAVYRLNRIYTMFTESYNWGSGNVSAIRYVVFNPFTYAVQFDDTYGADGMYYYYPAICPDFNGNIVIVFNRSSSTEYAGIRYSGRKTTDSNMQSSASLKTGEAYYVKIDNHGRNRWGDYSGIGRDPVDGSVWIYSEYARPGNQWGTQIGQVSFTSVTTTTTITTITSSSTTTTTTIPSTCQCPTWIANGCVSGRVTHKKTGAPLAGRTVRVKGTSPKTKTKKTTTDSTGCYVVTGLADGTYKAWLKKKDCKGKARWRRKKNLVISGGTKINNVNLKCR